MDKSQSRADSDYAKAEILAATLGIGVEDVLRWVINDRQELDRNGMVAGYLIEFAEGTPASVLARVGGRSGRHVHVGALTARH